MLLSVVVKTLHRAKIVIGTAVYFYINSHSLEKLELVSVKVDLENLSLVLLEKPCQR